MGRAAMCWASCQDIVRVGSLCVQEAGGMCCATRRVGMAPRASASSAAFGLAEEGNAKARRVHSDRV